MMIGQLIISIVPAIIASILSASLTGYFTFQFSTFNKYRDRLKEAVDKFYAFDGSIYASHEKEIVIAVLNLLDSVEIYLNICNVNKDQILQYVYDICNFFLNSEQANDNWYGFEVYLDSPVRQLGKLICKNMPLIPRKSSGTVTIKTESGEVSISSVSDIEKLVLDEYKERRKKVREKELSGKVEF